MQMVVDFWVVQIQRVIDVVVVVAVVQVAVVAAVVVQKVVHQQNDVVAVAVAFVVVVEDHPVYEKMLVDDPAVVLLIQRMVVVVVVAAGIVVVGIGHCWDLVEDVFWWVIGQVHVRFGHLVHNLVLIQPVQLFVPVAVDLVTALLVFSVVLFVHVQGVVPVWKKQQWEVHWTVVVCQVDHPLIVIFDCQLHLDLD